MLKLSPGMNVRPLAQACTASNLVVSTCKPRPGTCLPNYPPRYITVQRHMHMGCERGTATSKQACSCIMTCGSESRAAHRAPGLQRSQAHAARVRKARRRRGAPGRGRRHRRLALPGGQHAPRRWPCSAADARVCQTEPQNSVPLHCKGEAGRRGRWRRPPASAPTSPPVYTVAGCLGTPACCWMSAARRARTRPGSQPRPCTPRAGCGGGANSLAHPQATWVRGDQTRPSCRTQASAHVYGRQATREGRMASPPAAPQPPALSPAAPAAPAAPATHGALAT